MKFASNGVIIVCGTILALAVLASYVFLANSGKDAAEISRFVNTLLNFAMLVIGSIAAVTGSAAAKASQEARDSAQQTVSQTNGALDARIETAIVNALERQANGETPAIPQRDDPKLF